MVQPQDIPKTFIPRCGTIPPPERYRLPDTPKRLVHSQTDGKERFTVNTNRHAFDAHTAIHGPSNRHGLSRSERPGGDHVNPEVVGKINERDPGFTWKAIVDVEKLTG